MKISILDSYKVIAPNIDWSFLNDLGEVSLYSTTPEELVFDRTKDADIVVLSKTIISDENLRKMKNVKYITYMSTGYNTMNIELARSLGIIVSNIPGYSSVSIAQMVFSYILYFANRVDLCNQSVKNGDWQKIGAYNYAPYPQTEIANKTIGIIGFGNIGQKVAKIALGFDMNVLVYTTSPIKTDLEVTYVDLETLLRNSEYVTLHIPLNSQNENFVNETFLSQMKKKAILINTSRGKIIDEKALNIYLENDTIAFAAMDVLSEEPPINNVLIDNKKAIITPHCAWATKESIDRMLNLTRKNIIAFTNNKPINVVI